MRVALCLSGLPRFIEQAYPSIRDNILNQNQEIDIFCHSWETPENYQHKFSSNSYDPNWKGYSYNQKEAFEFINKFYQPKNFKIDNTQEYKNSRIETDETYRKYYHTDLIGNKEFEYYQIRNSLGMFRSILECNLLKKNYELQHDFKYDYVIRSRYDTIVGHPVICSTFDPKYVFYEEMHQIDGMISDWLNLSSSKNMDLYSSVYNIWEVLYERLMDKMGRFCNELLIKEMLETFDIPTRSTYWALRIPRK